MNAEDPQDSQLRVRTAWEGYWKKQSCHDVSLDEMSGRILLELLGACGPVKGKKILEAGCGRGVISAGLAERGADVTLLDISPEALALARTCFEAKGLQASLQPGDILDLPFPEAAFDVVWNAGVMEHFEGGLRQRALRQIARTVKPGGLFVSFNPSADAVFYTLGKRHAERKGIWPYGPEFPLKSLDPGCRDAGLTVSAEYPICFRENLSYLAYYSKHLRSMLKLLFRPLPEHLLMRLFGGYLLATVARREGL